MGNNSTILEELNDCIDMQCSKHGIKKSVLMEWNGKVINKVDEKVKTLSIEISSKLHKSVLQQNMSLNALNDVHNHFVVTQVDEANESVVFICQQFYVL